MRYIDSNRPLQAGDRIVWNASEYYSFQDKDGNKLSFKPPHDDDKISWRHGKNAFSEMALTIALLHGFKLQRYTASGGDTTVGFLFIK